MTYSDMAAEYLKSARVTERKIHEYEKKKEKCKSAVLRCEYGRRIDLLYNTYCECMYRANQFRIQAEKLNRIGLGKLIMV